MHDADDQEFEELTVTADATLAGLRLDVFCSKAFEGLTRNQAQKHIDEDRILLNGMPGIAATKIKSGDVVSFLPPPPEPLEPAPEDIPLDVIYEDDELVVIDKPPGLVVHPAAGHRSGTLVNALLHHFTRLSAGGGPLRPGLVHRLDRDTSGVMVISKNDRVHLVLSRAFADRDVAKVYHALVYGTPNPPAGTIDAPIKRSPTDRKKFTSRGAEGRPAVTQYKTLASHGGLSHVEARPRTGRTHQIRVHLADAHYPVVADSMYCAERRVRSIRDEQLRAAAAGLKRHALHALSLEFTHPVSGKRLCFVSPLPDDMLAVVKLVNPQWRNPRS